MPSVAIKSLWDRTASNFRFEENYVRTEQKNNHSNDCDDVSAKKMIELKWPKVQHRFWHFHDVRLKSMWKTGGSLILVRHSNNTQNDDETLSKEATVGILTINQQPRTHTTRNRDESTNTNRASNTDKHRQTCKLTQPRQTKRRHNTNSSNATRRHTQTVHCHHCHPLALSSTVAHCHSVTH